MNRKTFTVGAAIGSIITTVVLAVGWAVTDEHPHQVPARCEWVIV